MVGPPEGPTKIDKDKDVHAFEENTLKSRDKRDKNLPTVLEIVDHNFLSTVLTLSTMTIRLKDNH